MSVPFKDAAELDAGGTAAFLRIVPEENTVVVGRREELLARGLIASRVNWLLDGPPLGGGS